MIDCKVKDQILFKIVNESPEMTFGFDSEDAYEIFGFHRDIVSSVLDYFESIGLIDQDKFLEGGILLEILVPAHDLVSHGGFTAKEELLAKNLSELLHEIEILKPLLPQKVEQLTTIISGITAGMALIKPVK